MPADDDARRLLDDDGMRKIELPPGEVSDFGRRLHRLAVMFDCESWRAFDRLVGTTPNHLLAAAKSGNCEGETLAKIRRATGVNLNWLVCEDEDDVLSSPTSAQTEAILKRSKRRRRDGHAGHPVTEPKPPLPPTGVRKRAH